MMRPAIVPQHPPSVGAAPIVDKLGAKPRHHLSAGQTLSPTTSDSPTPFTKENLMDTTTNVGHTTSPSVSLVPSGVPILSFPGTTTSTPLFKQASSKPNRMPLQNHLHSESPSTIYSKPTIAPSRIPLQTRLPSESPSRFPSKKSTKGSKDTPTVTLSLSLTAKPSSDLTLAPSITPTLHPSDHQETIQSDPLTFQTFEQNSHNAGTATNAAMSRSSGGTTSIVILAIATILIALIIFLVRTARRKKYLGADDIHAFSQDQQHLTLQGSTTEIQGYVQRIHVAESNHKDDFNENESSKSPGSPTGRSVSSRPWDRDVNQHFAQHFSPRSLVDQPSSSMSMSTHDDESSASSSTSLGLQLPPEFSTPSANKLRARNKTSWVAQQNATFQVYDSLFEHASVSMERTAGRLRNAEQMYFCSAPMGPLGLIVDSSPNGPFVHSLKPNSPLTGLLKPGDYIIAVDDVNTRQMNAATLTQLMAKLATNPVRKITFLKGPSRVGTRSI